MPHISMIKFNLQSCKEFCVYRMERGNGEKMVISNKRKTYLNENTLHINKTAYNKNDYITYDVFKYYFLQNFPINLVNT